MRRVLLTRTAALAAAALVAVGWPSPAAALPALGDWTGATGLDASATTTTTEDVAITVSVSGDQFAIHQTHGLNGAPFGAPEPDTFVPPLPVEDGWLGLSVPDENCPELTTCDRGTLTISFDSPVIDPVVHVSGLGSQLYGAPAGTAQLALSGSEPAGATFGEPGSGAVNLAVVDGVIQVADPDTAFETCAEGAGCGSVPVTGIVDVLVFDVALFNLVENTGGDDISILVSAPAWVEPAAPPELPVTGLPALVLVGLGAAGLLAGGSLFGVRARARWRGARRA